MSTTFLKLDKATAIVLGLVLVLFLWGAYVLHARQSASMSPATPGPSESSDQPRAETVRLAEQPLDVEFTRRGILQPSGEVSVYPEATGRVTKRLAGVGDAVHRGDAILELDGSLLEIRLSEAQSRLKSAQIRSEEAQTQLADAEKTEDDDMKRDARLRRDAAEAAVKVAESQAAEAQKTYDARVVRSPIDGTVAQSFVEEGEFAAPAQPVAQIVVTDPIRAEVPLTAQETASLGKAVECRVALRDGEGSGAAARLVRIAPVADPRTKRIAVEVEAQNEAGRLRAGMPVDVTFRSKSSCAVLLLPRRALTQREGSLVCFRIQKSPSGYVARRVEPVVEPIPGRPESLKVISGLSAGDTVAVGGMIALDDGSAVQLGGGG